jgi:geranylgeranyl pyrophosphate synthase
MNCGKACVLATAAIEHGIRRSLLKSDVDSIDHDATRRGPTIDMRPTSCYKKIRGSRHRRLPRRTPIGPLPARTGHRG